MHPLHHSLLTAANPRFTESAEAGSGEILLAHQAANPAPAEQLAQLEQQLNGASPELLALYRAHNGAQLYTRRSDPLTGLIFVPIAEMAELKSDLERWFASADELDEDERGEYQTCEGEPAIIGTPNWWTDAVVFAYFGYTPESLIMPITGKYRGQIFIYEHDGGDDTSRIATSFPALMQQIAQASVPFFQRYYTASQTKPAKPHTSNNKAGYNRSPSKTHRATGAAPNPPAATPSPPQANGGCFAPPCSRLTFSPPPAPAKKPKPCASVAHSFRLPMPFPSTQH